MNISVDISSILCWTSFRNGVLLLQRFSYRIQFVPLVSDKGWEYQVVRVPVPPGERCFCLGSFLLNVEESPVLRPFFVMRLRFSCLGDAFRAVCRLRKDYMERTRILLGTPGKLRRYTARCMSWGASIE